MDEMLALMHNAGIPISVASSVLVTLLLLDRLKLLGRHAQGKSDRELLTVAETEFRQAILARLKASEARGDVSEIDRAQMRVDLDACEKRHEEAEKTFRTALTSVRDDLARCERKHQDIAERNENLEHSYALLTRSYQSIADRLAHMLTLLQERDADFLFDLGSAEIAPMPADVEELLASTPPPERRAYRRRQQDLPAPEERRIEDRRKP